MVPEDRIDLSRATDHQERKAITHVKEHGVHILQVFDAEEKNPDFSYTMGLWHTYRHPEVLIIGLKDELCFRLLNNIKADIAQGERFVSGVSSISVLDGFRCYFEEVPSSAYHDYLGWNLWFYDDDEFKAVQMLWPDISSTYPWQHTASDYLRWDQPILTKIPHLIS